jgi:hypothetical protein
MYIMRILYHGITETDVRWSYEQTKVIKSWEIASQYGTHTRSNCLYFDAKKRAGLACEHINALTYETMQTEARRCECHIKHTSRI